MHRPHNENHTTLTAIHNYHRDLDNIQTPPQAIGLSQLQIGSPGFPSAATACPLLSTLTTVTRNHGDPFLGTLKFGSIQNHHRDLDKIQTPPPGIPNGVAEHPEFIGFPIELYVEKSEAVVKTSVGSSIPFSSTSSSNFT